MIRRCLLALFAMSVCSGAPLLANDVLVDCVEKEWCVDGKLGNDRCVGGAYVLIDATVCDELGNPVADAGSACTFIPNSDGTDPFNVCGTLPDLDAGTYVLKVNIRIYAVGENECGGAADAAYYEALAASCADPKDNPIGGCVPGTCVKSPEESPPFECDDPPGGDGQGCTPGFWKNHLDAWEVYSPDDVFDDVFGVSAFGSLTLLEVASQGGGDLEALGRHAVAALLNSTFSEIDYDLSTAEVLDATKYAIDNDSGIEDLKDVFEEFNEQGCLDD